MHIAYISDQRYPKDGTDTAQIVTMCSALAAAGAKVTLYHLADRSGQGPDSTALAEYYEVEPTFDTIHVPIRPRLLRGFEKVALANDAATRIAQSSADLIYSRNLPAVIAGLRRTTLPVFYETYRPWPHQSRFMTMLFGRLRRQGRLRGLILHSQLAGSSYLEVGYDEERVLVAHNGYDPAVLGKAMTRAQARDLLRLPDRFTITYGGNVRPSKGVGMLLDMAEQLPDVELLVGYRSPNPIERRAEKMENVHAYGWRKISEVSPFLFAADLLVIPPTAAPLEHARDTVLPIKSFHYLAAGRPILAGDTPDIREVIQPGRNGIIVPPGDISAAVSAVQDLMQSPAECERLGENALEDARGRTWSARAKRVLDFLQTRMA